MKTPILRPATEAVLFGFERIGMVIRIAWLPIVIAIGLYAGAFFSLIGAAGFENLPVQTGDPEEAFKAIFESPGFMTFYALTSTLLPLLVSLVLSCVYVAVTRASTLAAYEPPNLPFYFTLGPREIRYFVARLLYVVLIILVTIAVVAAGAGVAAIAVGGVGAAEDQAKALVIAPAIALGVMLALVWLWVVLRFLPVLPIAAVENRIAFGDAWKMTKGNFWRILLSGAMFVAMLQGLIFVFILAIAVPAAIVLGVVAIFSAGIVGPAAFALMGLLVVVLIPGIIALAAFGLAAQAAYPARLYAYLSGCGDDCKI
jgi:hypothetical protein